MFAAAIVIFREAIEAGLIVGIVLAATRGVPHRGTFVALGVGGGALGACLLAVFAGELASLFAGSGQDLFNAAILLIAVGMLGWHNAWMAAHGRDVARNFKAVGAAVAAGERTLLALAGVCGIAVLREGFEVVLFLAGIAASGGLSASSLLGGGALGLAGGAVLSALMYRGLLAIPLRRLFAVTGTLITLLAAGLAMQAVGFLHQAGVIEGLATPLWDSSALLPQSSVIGRVLQTLVGYTDQPDAAQALAYIGTIAAMFLLTRRGAGRARAR